MLLWCGNVKRAYCEGRYASFLAVNDFTGKERYLGACLLPLFYSCWLFLLSILFVKTLSKTQQDDWFHLGVYHLVARPNRQSYTNCEINRLVSKTRNSLLNHMLDWLVTVLLWYDLFQPKTDLFSTRALILVYFKTVRYFSQSIFSLFLYWKMHNTI